MTASIGRTLALAVSLFGWSAADAKAEDPTCQPEGNYCLKLEPSARVYGAAGAVRLVRPATTPFTVAVDRDGRHQYTAEFHLQGLPDPGELGAYSHYVAWVVDPDLSRMERLGLVRNGVTRAGVIGRNKYMIWVSAEADSSNSARSGPLVFRGLSPSSRMEAHGFMGLGAFMPPEPEDSSWVPPPMVPGVRMMPGMSRTRPTVAPWLPAPLQSGEGREAAAPAELHLADGDTLHLTAGPVTRTIGGKTIQGFAYNGQIPGPLLRVDRGTEIVVSVTNRTAEPTAVHWHGLRLENRFDGVPGLTQDPIPPGGQFTYRLRFPDAGLYWYHPHHREDVWQDQGLFGNIRVDADWLPPVDREETLIMDDVLLGPEEVVPYGKEAATFALMGRFGNVLLTNDQERWDIQASAGERVRILMTNVSNTRTFNWSVEGHVLQVMATDVGPFSEPVWTESAVVAPAERYVLDLEASAPGRYAITNRVQAIDHGRGRFFSAVDTLGFLEVGAPKGMVRTLPARAPQGADIPPGIDAEFLAELPVYRLDLMLRTQGLPAITRQMMLLDQAYFNPVEWSGTMRHMNWSSSSKEVEWILRDPDQETENMDVSWSFAPGDLVRVKLRNSEDSRHAMQHPIHFHGQRFVLLSVNGEANQLRAWKDTILVPVGTEVEILLELSNPGAWMVHCHIAEHLSSGMKMVFEVDR